MIIIIVIIDMIMLISRDSKKKNVYEVKKFSSVKINIKQ